MGYIYQYDKRNGKTYVYEKTKKTNPKTGEIVDARKIIGRLDKETNTIVPTGKKGPKPKSDTQRKKSEPNVVDYASLYKEANIQLAAKNEELKVLHAKYDHMAAKMKQFEIILEEAAQILKS